MWMVHQADDPFVCFDAKPKKGLGLEISDETGSGGGKADPGEVREELAKEPREGQLAKEPREEELAKRYAERQSRTDSSPELTTVGRRKQ